MKTVTSYMAKQVLGMTLLAALVLCFMIWLFRSLQVVDMVLNRGVSLGAFIYFASLLFPRFLLYVAPMAVFGASLFTYNKMIADSELVVMRSAGISHFALAKPVLIVALGVTALSFYMSTYLVPLTFREYKELQLKYRNDLPKLLQEGVFNTMGNGYTVYFQGIGENGSLRNVLVHDNRDRGRPKTYMAKEGLVHEGNNGQLVLTLKYGSGQQLTNRKNSKICAPEDVLASRNLSGCRLPSFDKYQFDDARGVEFDFFTDQTGSLYVGPRERLFTELLNPTSKDPAFRRDVQAELHYRLVTPMLPLTCSVVAIAILLAGSFSRSGQFKRILAAVACASAIIIATHFLRNYAIRQPWIIIVMYVVVLVPLAFALFRLVVPRQLVRNTAAAPQ